METMQTPKRREPLPTDSISELEFRRIAGLCLRCGVARGNTTPGATQWCDPCENAQLARENHYLNRRPRHAA